MNSGFSRAASLAWSGLAEVLERGDLVDGHRGAGLAQLAPPLAEPVDLLLAGVAVPGRGGVMDDRAPVLPEGDPAESCYQVLLALAVPSGLEAGPGAVAGDSFRLVPGGHLGHGGLVLGGQGFSIDVWAYQHSVPSRQTSWASR